ncbi:ubiquitin carboxyl-terminal hydrolase 42-like protein [Chytridium lagenaria]|nr:ubiquitin carboxyl-terminal hydrolase 42-like protein [Chytridium lagenaria]
MLLQRRIRFVEYRKGKSSDHGQDSSILNISRSYDIFPKEMLQIGWPEVFPQGPGLQNLGNTCFLNSVLQCLTYVPSLAMHLLSRSHSKICKKKTFCAFCELEAHVLRCFSGRQRPRVICPKNIVNRLKAIAKHLRVGRQEDAHEFLRYLIDSLQDSSIFGFEKVEVRQKESTIVHQIFGGYLQSQVACSKCQYRSNTVETILDISLEVRGCDSIEKALRHFTKPEHLIKNNQYFCSQCKAHVDATKKLSILQAPNVLALHLKRFEFSFSGIKLDKHIKFPLTLDIKPFTSSPSAANESYNLCGVLVHAGSSVNSGHYYSYVRSSNGLWYEMDDETVREVSVSSVLAQKAYILFIILQMRMLNPLM